MENQVISQALAAGIRLILESPVLHKVLLASGVSAVILLTLINLWQAVSRRD